MVSADQTNALGAVGALPRRLGRYELVTPIGRGGMAIVYAGRMLGRQGFERLVAVKVCFQSIREEPKFREMFLDEAKVAAHIHHPNVVATLDARDDDELYLVMDYVQGGSLAQVIRAVGRDDKEKRIPTATGLRICVDALAGLHAAHNTRDTLGKALDLVHRDVSPQNIMLGIDGVSRIVDFGIAKAVGREQETRAGEIKGKMSYLAPEQLLGEAVSPRTDVFAMGIVLWEVLAGRKLFQGATMEETVMALADLKVPSLREIRPEVTEAVQAIVEKSLQREPEARFASAGEMVDALERADMDIAPQRDVAALIERLLGDKLRQRAELIRKSAAESTATGDDEPSHESHQEEPSGTPAPSELPAMKRVGTSQWVRRNAVLLGAAAVMLATIGAVAMRRKPTQNDVPRATAVTPPVANRPSSEPRRESPPRNELAGSGTTQPTGNPAPTTTAPLAVAPPTVAPPTPPVTTTTATAAGTAPAVRTSTTTPGTTSQHAATTNPNATTRLPTGTTTTTTTQRRRRPEYRPDIL